jgi:hypothetical protein
MRRQSGERDAVTVAKFENLYPVRVRLDGMLIAREAALIRTGSPSSFTLRR